MHLLNIISMLRRSFFAPKPVDVTRLWGEKQPTKQGARLLAVMVSIASIVSTLSIPSTAAPPTASGEAGDTKMVIISWDAAADWIVDKLLADGKLPNVARLAKEGVRAEYVIPPFPSLTAAGHAAIWTGAGPDVNGITGNSVHKLPKSQHTVLETMSGFDSRALTAEPIWMTAVKNGKRALVLSATQSALVDVFYNQMKSLGISRDRLNVLQGRFDTPPIKAGFYSDVKALEPVSEIPGMPGIAGKKLMFRVGDTAFACYFFDSPTDPAEGYDTAYLNEYVTEDYLAAYTLKPGIVAARRATTTNEGLTTYSITENERSTARLSVRKFRIQFGLLHLASDGSSFLLYHTPGLAVSFSDTTPPLMDLMLSEAGVLELPFDEYKNGLLGAPLWKGGSGLAEQRLMELARMSVDYLRRQTSLATNSVLNNTQWDLLINYSDLTDGFAHIVAGYIDPTSDAYRPDIAPKMWGVVEELYGIHDKWIGEVLDASRINNAVVALVGDHGMQGVSRDFYANAVLKNAGLLFLDKDGKIDLSRTKALAPPWFAGGVVVNDVAWKSGVVPIADKAKVLAQAREALEAAVDPATGEKPVKKIYCSPNGRLYLGGQRTPDLVFDLEYDYIPYADVKDAVAAARLSKDTGMHGFVPWRNKMHTVFFASGPGLASGVTLKPMQVTGVMPTLCKAVGWPAPANATGRVSEEAIAESGDR